MVVVKFVVGGAIPAPQLLHPRRGGRGKHPGRARHSSCQVGGWGSGRLSQSRFPCSVQLAELISIPQPASSPAVRDESPAAVAAPVVARRCSLRSASVVATSSALTSLDSDGSSTPKASKINHRSSTTLSTTSTLGGLADEMDDLALPEASEPVGLRHTRKAPVVRRETVESAAAEAEDDEDEIEDVEMAEQGQSAEDGAVDEIVGFEDETMLWEAMNTQPVLSQPLQPRQSAPLDRASGAGEGADSPSKAPAPLHAPNRQQTKGAIAGGDAATTVGSPVRRQLSKPSPQNKAGLAPTSGPPGHSGLARPKKKSAFKSPLLSLPSKVSSSFPPLQAPVWTVWADSGSLPDFAVPAEADAAAGAADQGAPCRHRGERVAKVGEADAG